MTEDKIVVKISEDGSIDAETFGLEGIDCVDELNKLMKQIAEMTNDTKKPEYYKSKVAGESKVVVKK